MSSAFVIGDIVRVVNWSEPWSDKDYRVNSVTAQWDKTYYNITLVDNEGANICARGSFPRENLRMSLPSDTSFTEVMVGGMSAEELKTVIDFATARLVELTKNS